MGGGAYHSTRTRAVTAQVDSIGVARWKRLDVTVGQGAGEATEDTTGSADETLGARGRGVLRGSLRGESRGGAMRLRQGGVQLGTLDVRLLFTSGGGAEGSCG